MLQQAYGSIQEVNNKVAKDLAATKIGIQSNYSELQFAFGGNTSSKFVLGALKVFEIDLTGVGVINTIVFSYPGDNPPDDLWIQVDWIGGA